MSDHSHTSGDLLDNKTSGYAMAFGLAAIFNALLVLLKENVQAVFKLMAALGHHWVTHGVLVLIVFFALASWLSKGRQITGSAAVAWVVWGTIIGGGIIALFNLMKTMGVIA